MPAAFKPEKKRINLNGAYYTASKPQAHMGHFMSYLPIDILARFLRLKGHEVNFFMGAHATGSDAISFLNQAKRSDKVRRQYGITLEEIAGMEGPEDMARYIHHRIGRSLKKADFSIDFSVDVTTIDPAYKRFIQWQIRKMDEKGLIYKDKDYITTVCRTCGNQINLNDESLMDIDAGKSDLTTRQMNYDLVCFPIVDRKVGTKHFRPRAHRHFAVVTERPETILGATSIGLAKDGEYVVAGFKDTDDEWVVEKSAVPRLKDLGYAITRTEPITHRRLAQYIVKNPLEEAVNEILTVYVTPRVKADFGTGVIFRNPCADYCDWEDYATHISVSDEVRKKAIGIFREIDEKGHENVRFDRIGDLNELLREHGLPMFMPVISDSNGRWIYSPFVYANLGLEGRIMDKGGEIFPLPTIIDIVNKEVGKLEHHMNENTGKYAGMPVKRARDAVRETLRQGGHWAVFAQLEGKGTGEVYDRAGHLVRLAKQDQWVWDLGNDEVKRTLTAYLKGSGFTTWPANYLTQLTSSIIPEFRRRVAAWSDRKAIGTPFPLEDGWVVHALTDSVIYPLAYLNQQMIMRHRIKPESIDDRVFDYVILDKGDPKEVSSATGIPVRALKEWQRHISGNYPVDISFAGVEHARSHLPMSLLANVAVLPERYWIRNMYVNGLVRGLVEVKDLNASDVVVEKYGDRNAFAVSQVGDRKVPIDLADENHCRIVKKKGWTVEGGKVYRSVKMSKSYPDTVREWDAWLERLGSDGLRFYFAQTNDFTEDLVWKDEETAKAKRNLDRFRQSFSRAMRTVEETELDGKERQATFADKWLRYNMEKHLESVSEKLHELRFGSAITEAFYVMNKTLDTYLKADDIGERGIDPALVREFYTAQATALAPFLPKIAASIFREASGGGSITSWRKPDRKAFSPDRRLLERYAKVLADEDRKFQEQTAGGNRLNVAIFNVPDYYHAEVLKRAIEKGGYGLTWGEQGRAPNISIKVQQPMELTGISSRFMYSPMKGRKGVPAGVGYQ
ncbi:class I tRNA ligase family protein [Candidatus Woesearchaeota archaeon]|nr:class I tRNA ligase family protein [Candidatus Woesearchaeota archaeon]